MKTESRYSFLWALLCACMLAGAQVNVYAEDRVEVPAVDVPEPSPGELRPAEIHENSPEKPCSSCHSPINKDIESKLPNHFVTSKECDSCHYTQRWTPLKIYSHINARYRRKPGVDPQDCGSCHISNSQFLAR